ncbi:MAG: ATP-dependent DNA helicase RecG [Paludibacteraceae bacterium]|nr:ATP-dependent DNA helicase RecG [Paludibacteraceae bacterium]MBP6284111.1 ATP-dependent DNA helicase RecG [Paludibacteraceae bacterium]
MYLPSMGPKRAQLFNKELAIFTIKDLLYHFPYKYIDRSRFYYIHEIDTTLTHIQIRGKITDFQLLGEGRNQRLVAKFTDGQSSIELVFFKGLKFVLQAYQLHTDYVVFGKPSLFNGSFSIVHPDIEPYKEEAKMGFQPLYHTTERMKSKYLNSKAVQKLIHLALQQINLSLAETLPTYIIQKYHFVSLSEAIANAHFPTNMALLERAQARLKFEELFYIQLAILRQANKLKTSFKGFQFTHIGDMFNGYYEKCLPFTLTNAQKKVLKEIRNDVRGAHQMNRLLQGDVGSGKTIVALMSMLMAIDNGYQACIMAPTEILATQHFETIHAQLEALPLTVELLTGSTKKKERERIHAGLLDGSIHFLIGTHALIEDTVKFQNLGLVVIDEQHRFGVAQRAKLWNKNTRPPHVLVMTATPIPRTLAMTVYGDLEVSVIDELPPGRKPIITNHIFEDTKRESLNRFLQQQISLGRQIYMVFPLIEESEKIDLKNLTDGYQYMRSIFPDLSISMVHGKMKPVEKEAAMQEFIQHKANILVATTVIEVGVNVPNASVMVIENAERFGLAQLHQLRGRVGRGADQSYCVLVTSRKISNETRKRLEIMTRTNDGFEIAEADLQLRGPGDLEGTQQSGIPFQLHIANLARDGAFVQLGRECASEILNGDPQLSKPEHAILLLELKNKKKEQLNWSIIS